MHISETRPRATHEAKALAKGLDVLDKLAAAQRGLTFTELVQALRFPKATTHRLLRVLEARRYLERNAATGAYWLGLKLWQLGCARVNRLQLREVARPFLEELARKTEEHVNLAVLDGTDAVFVDIIESVKPIRPYTYVGGRVPLYCSATGKAMLAFQPETCLAAVLRGGLKPFTARTITGTARLRVELRRVRSLGYAVNREEWRDDVCGLAAPIRNHEKRVEASVSITTPASRFDEETFRPLVVSAGHAISLAMGSLPETTPDGRQAGPSRRRS